MFCFPTTLFYMVLLYSEKINIYIYVCVCNRVFVLGRVISLFNNFLVASACWNNTIINVYYFNRGQRSWDKGNNLFELRIKHNCKSVACKKWAKVNFWMKRRYGMWGTTDMWEIGYALIMKYWHKEPFSYLQVYYNTCNFFFKIRDKSNEYATKTKKEINAIWKHMQITE